MPLKEYRRKRQFKKTSEPRGKPTRKNKTTGLCFVIQKHAASHLHYDLRLEIDGVLKSWAVPKGPPLSANQKHLAIAVEDHPLAYKDFEGIIPPGNYGAGKVIIWDEGNYEPDDKTITDANHYFRQAWQAGHLSFVLNGKKLHGKYSLIKIKSPQKNAWLFLKEKSNTKSKPITEKSVRSGLALQQMSNSTAIGDLTNAPKSTMPKVVDPMLATAVNQSFDDPNWLFEIKWDGYRIISFLNRKKVKLLSRNHQDYTDFFESVSSELATLNLRAIFDGEMVVVDKKGKSRFELMQKYQSQGKGQLVYYIFDILWFDGHDLQGIPLQQRKKLLTQLIPSLHYVQVSEHIEAVGKKFFKTVRAHRLEGIVAKEKNSVYLEGVRTRSWLKIKSRIQQEAVICGYTAPKSGNKLLGALILGIYNRGRLIYIGHTGTGFNEQTRRELKTKLDRLAQPHSPFEITPKTNSPVTWAKPQLVCEVAFHEWTQSGYLRQPAFLGLRTDKLARSVHREVVIPAQEILHTQPAIPATTRHLPKKIKANPDKPPEEVITINKHRLQLTNLDKVLWPESGYTKKDLIEYYRMVAKFILPHLKDRLQVLHRFPNGIHKNSFYQKNIETKPSWVKTKSVFSEHEERKVNYLMCQNEAHLIYMANLGCIEMNPWLSRYTDLENPDFCVLDLDPEKIEFEAVIEVAKYIHQFLQELDVPHFCKTSGATGLHIYLPLKQKYSFEQSKQFAEWICSNVHQQLPEITSVDRMKKKRQGKVYLDFLQNRFGQTIAAPYSIRPHPNAPVSTPLHWHELKKGLNPSQFTIQTIHARLAKEGDIWRTMLRKGINIAKVLKKLA